MQHKSILRRHHAAIGYTVVFVALAAFLLSWKLFVARDSAEDATEYQRRIEITAANITTPPVTSDDTLKLLGVNVVHRIPSKSRFIGYGIYLGHGLVLTAAHVVGRWPLYTNPRVIIGGLDLSAHIIKEGLPEQTDLALISVDQERLPISLRLRRTSLCKETFPVGTNVSIVYPELTRRTRLISPLRIPPQYRMTLHSLIDEPEGSGSGVFQSEKKCLLGIVSGKVAKLSAPANGRMPTASKDFAGYYVPVSVIAKFLSTNTQAPPQN